MADKGLFQGSILQNSSNYNSNITVYPQSLLHKAKNYITMFDTTDLPYGKQFNNCKNDLCYTSNKGTFIYKPHSGYGLVGRTSAGYLFQRRRL